MAKVEKKIEKVELVYFEGCPKISEARAALVGAGVSEFEEVSQGDLAEEDPRRGYSSPSLLVDGRLVIGLEGDEPSCSLHTWDKTLVHGELARSAPICSLGDAEFRTRQSKVREVLRRVEPSVVEHEDGYEFRLEDANLHLAELMELVRLERQCCPSLGFVLKLEPGVEAGSLRIFGSKGAKELLADLLTGLTPASTQ